jgi:hypothetical protein
MDILAQIDVPAWRPHMKTTLVLTLAFLALLPSAAFGGVVAANWTNATSGTLNGVSFTFSPAGTGLTAQDLSGSSYSAFPLSSSQQVVTYTSSSNWTVTFGQPVSDLLLYDRFWRGVECLTNDEVLAGRTTCSYTFSAPFSVFGNALPITVSGQTLTIPNSVYGNGILRFSGPLTTLSVTTDLSQNGSIQNLTFAVVTGDSVPEPWSLQLAGLGGMGMAVMAFLRRKK